VRDALEYSGPHRPDVQEVPVIHRQPVRALAIIIAGLSLPASIAAVAGLPAAAAAQEARNHASPDTSTLPIRAITLYRSGVGFFERGGLIEGSERIQLRFATDQINDIIKSMIILDRGGGRIDGVSYGSKEPLDRRLASFGIDLSDQPNLNTILARLRGAPVRFTMADGTVVEGRIIGGETRPEASGNLNNPVQVPYLNLLTREGIRYVNLTKIAALDILDPQLKEELGKALEALAEHRADRVKSVDISFSGQGSREAVVAYVHEMPVWKTSYRLVLPEGDGGQPMVQGWAIVENTTDEDWLDVRLSLVAGRPVSFTMDLYEPLFAARPQVPVPFVAGAAPRVYESAVGFATRRTLDERAQSFQERDKRAPAAPEPPARPRAGLGDPEGRVVAGVLAEDLYHYAPQSQARGADVGEVFQYQLTAPVSIARQRSAMLPILNTNTDGRRVSIYSRRDGQHPMRGVEIRNTTGLQMMPGPISVFDGAAYAGDAQIGHISAGDKRLLSYAVDLNVAALVRDEQQATIGSIKIVDGLIHQRTRQVATATYAFENRDQKRPRTILVEHPRMQGWDLVEPSKPAEETQDIYRFELSLRPGESGAVRVIQERIDLERLAVAGYDLGMLTAHAQQGRASKAVVDAVRKAADMQAAINETQRRIEQLDQERAAIDQDQARIRQNLATLQRDTELYRRYITRLNEQETRLEEIRSQRQAESQRLQSQQADLRSYLRDLRVE
jgi:hypothetical protein